MDANNLYLYVYHNRMKQLLGEDYEKDPVLNALAEPLGLKVAAVKASLNSIQVVPKDPLAKFYGMPDQDGNGADEKDDTNIKIWPAKNITFDIFKANDMFDKPAIIVSFTELTESYDNLFYDNMENLPKYFESQFDMENQATLDLTKFKVEDVRKDLESRGYRYAVDQYSRDAYSEIV